MKLNKKVLIIITIIASVSVITFYVITQYYTALSPKPEIIETKQTWAESWVGSQPTYINVTVKNNGHEGWVTVYIEYQTGFDRDGNAIIRTESQQVYMMAGETKTVNWTLHKSDPEYHLPQLTKVYAKS
jgi:hypothetical protein